MTSSEPTTAVACVCGHPQMDHYFGDALGAGGRMHTWCQRHDGCQDYRPIEAEAAAGPPASAERLMEVVLTALRMIEDGHPDDRDWFRIMAESLHRVDDLTDAALLGALPDAAQPPPASVEAEGLDVELLARAMERLAPTQRVIIQTVHMLPEKGGSAVTVAPGTYDELAAILSAAYLQEQREA